MASQDHKATEVHVDDTVLLYWEENAVKELWKERSRKVCDPAIKEFAECGKGRTVSVVWACRSLKNAMMTCLRNAATQEAYDEVRVQYLRERAEKRARGEL